MLVPLTLRDLLATYCLIPPHPRFSIRNTSLHSIHGSPTYPHMLASNITKMGGRSEFHQVESHYNPSVSLQCRAQRKQIFMVDFPPPIFCHRSVSFQSNSRTSKGRNPRLSIKRLKDNREFCSFPVMTHEDKKNPIKKQALFNHRPEPYPIVHCSQSEYGLSAC